MGSLFVSLLTLVLILISAFVVLLVLMQRTSQSGGMGGALGGGATESAFGSETNNVLTKATIYSTIAFFVVSLGLFLIYQSKVAERNQTLNPKELISAPEPKPAEPTLVEEALTPAEGILESAAETTEKTLTSVMETVEEGLTKAENKVEATSEQISNETLIPTADAEMSGEDPAADK